MFKALLLNKEGGTVGAGITELDDAALPPGEVLVGVEYSTLNYKDALGITGKAPIARSWPMVAGIDLAGTVIESSMPQWRAGDEVLLNGWGLGETHWGGLAQRARVQAGWLTRRPTGMSARTAMAIGTAGYTAMLCVMALEKHGLTPERGEVLVTGAAGGVGSVAISVLAKRGFSVVAASGRLDEREYLIGLGARSVISREELNAPGKPLGPERWAGAVDSVGSHTLANACAMTKSHGAVAACGLAQGMDFPATVAPFILRGVSLYGIESVRMPAAVRDVAWARLAAEIDSTVLAAMTREITLDQAIETAGELLAGRVRGRVVVRVAS